MSWISVGVGVGGQVLGGILGKGRADRAREKKLKQLEEEYKLQTKLGMGRRDQLFDEYGMFGNRGLLGLSDDYIDSLNQTSAFAPDMADQFANFDARAQRASQMGDTFFDQSLGRLADQGAGGYAATQRRKLGSLNQARGLGGQMAAESNQDAFANNIAQMGRNLGVEGGMGTSFAKGLGQGLGAGFNQSAQIGSQAAQDAIRSDMRLDDSLFSTYGRAGTDLNKNLYENIDREGAAFGGAISNRWSDVMPFATRASNVVNV